MSTDSLDGKASRRIVGASVSLNHKMQKMASNNGGTDKGCSELCITVAMRP